MESSTQVLRRLLDERGVEWWKPSKDSERWTHWHGTNDTLFTASEDARGCVWIGASLTPEQAIAATLGRESYGKDAEQGERSTSSERESYDTLKAENAKLRELVRDLYCIAYENAVEWEASYAAYNKYCPCEKCHELHGGKSPCAGTAADMTEECCAPIQASVVADRMRELGIEVD